MHAEFGITHMDSIEKDSKAYSRQLFNNPYSFIKLNPVDSTEYINGHGLKFDRSQIIWLDFATTELAAQLKDVEQLAWHLEEFDILKLTFNAHDQFINHTKKFKELTTDETLKFYAPPNLKVSDLTTDYSGVIRKMAFKAIKRGLAASGKGLLFTNLTSFTYSDGQRMTTMTGIISLPESVDKVLKESGLKRWNFSNFGDQNTLQINTQEIQVPVMTIAERIAIDRKLKKFGAKRLAESLKFSYGDDDDSDDYHEMLINGYIKFYSFLPFYSRVTI
jgi:hypothetical protein